MIEFKISAPSRLSLFGEHTVKHGIKGLTASLDMRSTVTFKEVSTPQNSSILQIDLPQFYSFFEISLQEFPKFYKNCNKNINLLSEKVLEYTNDYTFPANHKIIIQAFYYLLIYITYTEQLVIKPFTMHLSTELMMDENMIVSPASFAVCIAAAFLHWSRLQKGVHDTFDSINLDKIRRYAARFEQISSECGIVDVTACTYNSVVEYQKQGNTTHFRSTPVFEIDVIILLVDSKMRQNLEAQTQKIAEFITKCPLEATSILNRIDTVTNTAFKIFVKLAEIYKNKLSLKTKTGITITEYEVLKTLIWENQKLLELLHLSPHHLDKIFAIAHKYGCYGKYTDISNGRYAYIWCPSITQENSHIKFLINELILRGYQVTETKLASVGVKIESMTQ